MVTCLGRTPMVALTMGMGVKCGMDAKCPLNNNMHTLLVVGHRLLGV